jgi:Domain of unknown function (DUF4177)
MRWSYKTVHYDLKKEGLLGGTFIDESEIELSLNEYGKAGWELVSILETQEGLLAVFKQLIAIGHQSGEAEEGIVRSRMVVRPERQQDHRFAEEPEQPEEPEKVKVGRVREEVVPVEEYEIVVEETQAKKRQEGESQDDIGTIRIE